MSDTERRPSRPAGASVVPTRRVVARRALDLRRLRRKEHIAIKSLRPRRRDAGQAQGASGRLPAEPPPNASTSYHYVESGLSNVWLKNGFRLVKAKSGEGVAIEDIEGLNRAIATVLVAEKPRLSGAELRFLRKELGLSQRVFSDLAGVEEQTVSLWERKDDEVPEQADRFVRALYISERDPGTKLRALLEKLQELDDREFALVANESRGKWLAKAA